VNDPRDIDLKEPGALQAFLRDPVARAVAPGDADGDLIFSGSDDLGDVLVTESRAQQDRLDLLFFEQARADFQGFSLVFDDDDVELVFAGVDKTAVLFFVRVRSMGKKERFECHGFVLPR
jgi:hypothetical protein